MTFYMNIITLFKKNFKFFQLLSVKILFHDSVEDLSMFTFVDVVLTTPLTVVFCHQAV